MNEPLDETLEEIILRRRLRSLSESMGRDAGAPLRLPRRARRRNPSQLRAVWSIAAAAVIGVIGVGGALAMDHDTATDVEAGSRGTASGQTPTTPSVNLELLIDESLPDLTDTPAPAGMIGVGDKSGVVRGFIPDEVEPVSEKNVDLADGTYTGPAYEVVDLDGEVTGYLLPGLGFVPRSVAADATALTTVLEQYQAVVDAAKAAGPADPSDGGG